MARSSLVACSTNEHTGVELDFSRPGTPNG
jgi:hypothetical protein